MSIAYWCVLIAALLPYVFTVMAKAGGAGYTNVTPRLYLEQIQGWRRRAHWAQLNSFEAFPFFAAGVIIAQRSFVHQTTLDIIAMLFIISRILYGVFYITNKASLRSLIWFVGFASCISLFIVAARS